MRGRRGWDHAASAAARALVALRRCPSVSARACAAAGPCRRESGTRSTMLRAARPSRAERANGGGRGRGREHPASAMPAARDAGDEPWQGLEEGRMQQGHRQGENAGRGEGRGVSDWYGVRDAACPISTRAGGGGHVLARTVTRSSHSTPASRRECGSCKCDSTPSRSPSAPRPCGAAQSPATSRVFEVLCSGPEASGPWSHWLQRPPALGAIGCSQGQQMSAPPPPPHGGSCPGGPAGARERRRARAPRRVRLVRGKRRDVSS
jgi:hypothetical protein